MLPNCSGGSTRRTRGLAAALLACSLASACELLPGGVTVAARAVPEREWVLRQDADGGWVSTLTDHLRGRRDAVLTLGLERGDHTAFRVHPRLEAGAAVSAGDTIGTRWSALAETRCAELRSDLGTELAYLELARSGDKASLVREAEARLSRARAETEQQERELARQRSLFDRHLIPQADLELAETAAQVADLQTRIAEEQVTTARTGDRAAQITWIETRVAGLRRQLELAEEEIARCVVCCPIAGRFVPGPGDTLAVVRDTASWAAVLPVAWSDRPRLKPGQAIEVRWSDGATRSSGALHRLDTDVYTAVDGRQFLTAVAHLDHHVEGVLAPGLVGQCHITCPSPSWLNQLRSALSL